MANVASGDWTIRYRHGTATGGSARNFDTAIAFKKKYIELKLELAASGKTWPKAGVAMPIFSQVGMVRYLDGYSLDQGPFDPHLFTTGATTASGRALLFSLSVTGNKLHAWRVKAATGTGLAVIRVTSGDAALQDALTLYVTAKGW